MRVTREQTEANREKILELTICAFGCCLSHCSSVFTLLSVASRLAPCGKVMSTKISVRSQFGKNCCSSGLMLSAHRQ